VKMLEDALGEGKVIARVNADLDFEKVERTEEIYDPDSQVVRSEQIVTESTTGAAPPGGVPGAQGLVPNPEAAGAAAGQPAQREKENQTFNYEINKVVRQISKPTGSIKKLSAAVLIDGTRGGEPPEYQPRSAEEMAKYTEIVKSALGYNEQRGDQIRVENIQFDRSFLLEEQARMEQAEMMDLGFQIAKYVLGAIFILLFFTRVIRPIINWMTTSLEVVPDTAAQLTAADLEAVEEEKKRLSQTGQEAADVRQAVADFVASDPKFTAGLVRKWMRDKGAPS
ncbi:MAG: flagellar M-ring protein FliF, partial [Nitrospinaceae bacterium]|nr:flagellar M-ring protein FliF [Nitrospinaceae bacterium]NIR55298.1 flagellar M-ring protein FliF [Nitrospinaceae bacterium]NIS85737.1 flagellar M-ring protein FliF [Nitrospinaceae bacterium]NIU44792.1 flagellar M-ring protein FliF [Nitrospinaceae bacterium]NIU96960.1 flagellar M-ring protein FliF [Nitrospinaceae bacterium]